MPRVVLYSVPGCHLCVSAMAALRGLAETHAFDLREVDVHSDRELERRFLLEIPVVEVDGEVVSSAPVDLDAVRRALATSSDQRERRKPGQAMTGPAGSS